MQSEQTSELSAALAKAQAETKAASFDKVNPHFKNKYASLAAVIDAIREPFAKNGLSYTQTTEMRDGGFVLVTSLRHASGQWIASEYPLPVAAKPQDLGSALTYARRYSLSAIACIAADEDDDAEGARTSGQTASAPKAKGSPIKPEAPLVPVNPETGEAGPHALTAENDMAWGALFVSAVNAASSEKEIDDWAKSNASGLLKLKENAPKVFDRVEARITEKRKSFNKEAA